MKNNLPFIRWYTLAVVIFVFGTLSIILLFWINGMRKEQFNYSLYIETLMDMEIEVSLFHLWFEEYLSGDRTINIEKSRDKIKRSKKFVQLLLTGGSNKHGMTL